MARKGLSETIHLGSSGNDRTRAYVIERELQKANQAKTLGTAEPMTLVRQRPCCPVAATQYFREKYILKWTMLKRMNGTN